MSKKIRQSIRKPSGRKGLLNRIVCGDVLSELQKVKGQDIFDIVIADPPYNIGKNFGNNVDSMSMEDYVPWSVEWTDECLRLLKPSGLLYMYGFSEILAHVSVRYPLENQRWLIWHYTNKAVPRLQFWQRSHESILCLWKDSRPKLFVDDIREAYSPAYLNCIGKERKETQCRYNRNGNKSIYNGHENGAMPRDVIKIPALAGGAGRTERWFMCKSCGGEVLAPEMLDEHRDCDILKHPTQKPLGVTARLIKSVLGSGPGKLLVPFAGSGSECVVANGMGVEYMGIEINEEYADFARKWIGIKEILKNE